jgi:hypothetical protein
MIGEIDFVGPKKKTIVGLKYPILSGENDSFGGERQLARARYDFQ